VLAGKRARGLLEIGRSHVVRRCVDEIAQQRDCLDHAFEIFAVEALRQIEHDLARLGFVVAREAICAEREGESREPRVVRIVGEAVDAGRQLLRQTAGQEQILGVAAILQAEQDAAQATLARQHEILAGLRLETRRIGEVARGCAQPLAHVFVGRCRDKPDWDRRRGGAGIEDRLHPKS
jgi:hypothetical protein